MTIYIQSRGKSQDHDHCWLEVTKEKDAQIQISPPALKEIKPEELIDSQRPSIILARSGQYLILLVMALKAGDERLDFMGRQIRNSVAWVEKNDPGKEQHLRKIVIRALNGKLVEDIDEAVTSEADSTYGFEANLDKLRAIGNSPDSQDVNSEEANPDTLLGFANNNKARKDELISELTRYALPISSDDIQIFVVDTTLKSKDGLEEKGVWRGLSSRIESEGWEKIDVSKSEKSQSTNSKKKVLVQIVVLAVVSLIALTTWVLLSHSLHQDLAPKIIAPTQQSKTDIIPPQSVIQNL